MTNQEAYTHIKSRLKEYIQCTDDNIALYTALKALEKQIPIKPKNYDDVMQFYIECPTCNKIFDSWFRYKDCTQHCPYCSQAISLYDKSEVTE